MRDHPSRFCFHCGKPFPWTVATINAAKELAEELDELSSGDRETLKTAIGDLVSDTPKTELAAHRYRPQRGGLFGRLEASVTGRS